jgi:hypothetical protein
MSRTGLSAFEAIVGGNFSTAERKRLRHLRDSAYGRALRINRISKTDSEAETVMLAGSLSSPKTK